MSNLNSSAAIRQEGAWHRGPWSDQITSDSAFGTFIDGLCAQANAELQIRVGVAFYAAVVNSSATNAALLLLMLTEAELHLVTARLCLAAATIADAGKDPATAPDLSNGTLLRADADEHNAWATSLIELTRTAVRPPSHAPAVRGKQTTAPALERFDPNLGVDQDPFDGTVETQ